jgi:hypothetical protein
MSQFTKREMLRAAQSTVLLGASTGGKPGDARAIAALGLAVAASRPLKYLSTSARSSPTIGASPNKD